jgi:hypothetical protein
MDVDAVPHDFGSRLGNRGLQGLIQIEGSPSAVVKIGARKGGVVAGMNEPDRPRSRGRAEAGCIEDAGLVRGMQRGRGKGEEQS